MRKAYLVCSIDLSLLQQKIHHGVVAFNVNSFHQRSHTILQQIMAKFGNFAFSKKKNSFARKIEKIHTTSPTLTFVFVLRKSRIISRRTYVLKVSRKAKTGVQ